LPVIGVPFRKTEDEVNEIELLILVTPEFVDPIDGCEVPCGGPGTYTTSPNNCGLYCAGHMEVPTYCNPTQGLSSCGGEDCNCNGGGARGNGGCSTYGNGAMIGVGTSVALPGGTGYDDGPSMSTQPALAPSGDPSQAPVIEQSAPPAGDSAPGSLPVPQQGAQNLPDDISLPTAATELPSAPRPNTLPASVPATPVAAPVAPVPPQEATPSNDSTSYSPVTPMATPAPVYTAPRPYSPQRQPVFLRNASRPYSPQQAHVPTAPAQPQSGLIGPVGYDVQ
jgi:hypothetical protein